MKKVYNLRIPEEMKIKLEEIAKKNGYSLNALILFIISDYLECQRSVKNGEQFTNI